MDTGEHAPPSLERKGQIHDIQTLLRGPAVSYHSDPVAAAPLDLHPGRQAGGHEGHRPALPRRRHRRVRARRPGFSVRALAAEAKERAERAGAGSPGPGLRPRRCAVRRAWPLLAALVAAAALLDLGPSTGWSTATQSSRCWSRCSAGRRSTGTRSATACWLPLLALPVRDPLWNLLLQRGLIILAGLAAVVLLARHLLAERDWPLTGAVAAATLLLAAPESWRFEYLGDQPYGLSLALALAGLAFAEPAGGGARRSRRRLAAGLLLVLLAHWVNPATGVLLGLLALARALEDWFTEAERRAVRERLLVDAGLLAVGLAAGQAVDPALPGPHRPAAAAHRRLPAAVPVALGVGRAWWPGPGSRAAAGAGACSPARRWGGCCSGSPRRGASGATRCSGPPRWSWRRWPTPPSWARWPGWPRTHHHPRYLAPSALLLHLAVISLLAEPLARAARAARPALAAALLALPLAALAAGGAPSLARVRGDLDAVAGKLTEDVLAARCQLVAGDYWSVWPAVWHAALVARERGLRDEAGDGPLRSGG